MSAKILKGPSLARSVPKPLKVPTRFIPLAGPLEGGDIWPFLCVWVAQVGGGEQNFFFVCLWPISKWPITYRFKQN